MKNHNRSFNITHTIAASLLLLSSGISYHNVSYATNSKAVTEHKQFLSNNYKVIRTIQDHIILIDFKLEESIQALKNDIVQNINDKKSVQKKLVHLRSFLHKALKETEKSPEKLSLHEINKINYSIISSLQKAYTKGFDSLNKSLNKLDTDSLSIERIYNTKSEFSQECTDKLSNALNIIDNQLKSLLDLNYQQPVNLFNKCVTSTDKFLEKTYLKKTLSKSLPYLGAFSLWVVSMDDDKLPRYLLPLKRSLLYPFKQAQRITRSSSESESAEASLSRARESIETEDSSIKYTDTRIGKTWNMLKKSKIMGLDNKPMFTVPITATLAKFIWPDIKESKKFIGKQGNKAWAYLKGEEVKDDSPVKKAKASFNFDKIIGYADIKDQFADTIRSYKYQSCLKNTGTYLQKGYILSGPISLSESIIKALAGELCSAGEDTWGTYTVTAGKLLDKRLKDLIKEQKDNTPYILVLKDLEAVASKNNFSKKTLSNLLEDIDSIIKNKDNKILVCAVTEDESNLHSLVKQTGRLDKTLSIEKPDYISRADFITDIFQEHGLDIENFDINELAAKTEDYTYQDIENILKKSFVYARCEKQRLTQGHISQVL